MQEGYSLTETLGTGAIECEHGRLHFLDVLVKLFKTVLQ